MTVALIASYAPSLVNFRGPMIRAMVRAGRRVVCLAPDFTPELRAELAALGAETRDYPLVRTGLNPLRDLGSLAALARILRSIRPDVVFAYTVKPVIYGSLAALLAGVPRRYSMITGLGYVFGQGGAARRGLFQAVRLLYRAALAGNTAVFFQNPDDRDLFLSVGIVSQKQQLVLTNGSGVDLDSYPHRPVPTDGIIFLCIARLLREKGVREFVAAASLLKARHPGAVFRLVGPHDPGPDSIDPDTVREWKAAGLVEVAGPVQDVRPDLAACSVYVLPSYREGTPRSVLEALATGRAVVTTDAPGCRQTVRPGETGFLVPVRDPEALARAMERFILDPGLAVAMGAAARRLAEEIFDVDRVNAVLLGTMGLAGDGVRAAGASAAGRVVCGPCSPEASRARVRSSGPGRVSGLPGRGPGDVLKRLFDLAVALPLLLILSPLLAGLALAVRLRLGPGVLFRQRRPGLYGRPFGILKFRTMTEARDPSGNLLPDAQRLPAFGRFLRSTSLDELPELLNVVLGDMSLVGPRPLLMQYLDRYSPRQARRHEVRPGITGWAQVNGRNAVTWEEKFEMDVWYVENRSLALDLRILWRTFLTVVRREGITQPGQATATEFMGSPPDGS